MLSHVRIKLTILSLLALALLSGGIFVAQHVFSAKAQKPAIFHGTLLDKPREIQPFSLLGIDGKPVTNQSLQGQWTMVFYGFTHCGGICPTTMAMLANMYHKLEEQQVSPLPHVMMISLDPDRDSLDKLANYVTAFNPSFYGAIGDNEAIQAMTKELGIVYQKVVADGNGDDIQHSGAILLFNPKGQLTAFFTPPMKAKLLIADFKALLPNVK